MNRLAVPVIVLSVLVSACGGGGSGGGGAAPSDSTGSAPSDGGAGSTGDGAGSTGSGNTEPAGNGTSTGTGSAEIVFPWLKSSALGNSVVVRGIAHDPDGIAGVSVNGIPAVLTPASAGQVSSAKSDSTTLGISPDAALTSENDTDVEWSAEVDLDTGDNDVVVAVEDSTGDTTDDADQAQIKYYEVPSIFTSDADDSRVVGWSTSLTQSGEVTRLVAFDHGSGQLTIYPELRDIGVASCLRGTANEFLYLKQSGLGIWEVRSFNLSTREASRLVSEIPSELIDAGVGFSLGPLLMQLVCSGTHEQAYLLANYWEDGKSVKSRILRIELSGGASMLTETSPDESPPWLARRIALSGDSLVSLYDINAVAPLTGITLAAGQPTDGERTVLAPTDVGGLAMVAALDINRVYVTTFDGVQFVDLNDPPSVQNISVVEPTDPLNFSQAQSIALDLVGNRVIVGDSDLDVLVAVDHDTGARTELLSRRIGAGPHMTMPARLVIAAGDTFAYVLDGGGNAPERLFELDLATGDRRVVGPIHEGVNRSITGVALDEQAGYAYVSRYDNGTVLQVDLATDEFMAITAAGGGLLEGIADVLFDSANQRLLVADRVTNAIVSVDVVTHDKVLISRPGERGEGEGFTDLASLTMNADGTGLYAADRSVDQLFHVDLATGDRQVVDLGCLFVGPDSSLRPPVNLRQVLYESASNALLVLAEPLFAFDLDTSTCTEIPMRFFPLGIDLTEKGEILAVGFHALELIDGQSGDVVIVSQ